MILGDSPETNCLQMKRRERLELRMVSRWLFPRWHSVPRHALSRTDTRRSPSWHTVAPPLGYETTPSQSKQSPDIFCRLSRLPIACQHSLQRGQAPSDEEVESSITFTEL